MFRQLFLVFSFTIKYSRINAPTAPDRKTMETRLTSLTNRNGVVNNTTLLEKITQIKHIEKRTSLFGVIISPSLFQIHFQVSPFQF